MVTYEEAKKIALDIMEQVGFPINSAKELPEAYVFDDAEHEYLGYLPMVIRKSDGKAVNYWQYRMQNNIKEEDVKEIPF